MNSGVIYHFLLIKGSKIQQMFEYNPEGAYVKDPISNVTRKVRKSLLVVSLLGITIPQTALIPTRITTLGVDLTQADQETLYLILSLIIVYFLFSFIVYSISDFIRWRIALLSAVREERIKFATMTGKEGEIIKEHEGQIANSNFEKWVRKYSVIISRIRIFLEFGFPIIFAVYATYVVIKLGIEL